MSEVQWTLLIGTIWIAPHAPKPYALTVGIIYMIVAILKGSGVIS